MIGFDWMDRGACVGKPADWWFNQTYERFAVSICHRCPSETQCRDYALRNERHGVWGGTTPRDRWKIRRQQDITLDPQYEGAYRAQRTTPRPEGDAA